MSVSFDLTPQQVEITKQANEFARKEIAPIAAEIDERDDSKLLLDIWKKMAQPPYAYTGMFIPSEYGGTPRSIMDICLIIEEVTAIGQSAVCVALLEVAGVGTKPLLLGGNDNLNKKYLPPIAKGEAIGCFGLTEPGIGSDAVALSTQANLVGDEYILKGRKRYLSFAHIAEYALVFAKTDPSKGAKGISGFVLPTNTPGFSVVEKVSCMGMRGHQDEEVAIDNCHIPKDHLIGEEGRGLRYALGALDDTRTTLTSGFIGLAKAALEEGVRFAKARKAFGQPIAEFQAISFPLTDIAIEIEAARVLNYKAAWLADKGEKHTVETAAAKAFASQLLTKATNVAMDVHGGFGGTKRFPIERILRDGRIWVFAQGTPNVQKLIVMRDLFDRLNPSPELLKEIEAKG